MGISIYVNGKATTTEAEAGSVQNLIDSLGLDPNRIAVELNSEVLETQEWGTLLQTGDKVELVHFVGGG